MVMNIKEQDIIVVATGSTLYENYADLKIGDTPARVWPPTNPHALYVGHVVCLDSVDPKAGSWWNLVSVKKEGERELRGFTDDKRILLIAHFLYNWQGERIPQNIPLTCEMLKALAPHKTEG
jgi:hypothetical protein